MTAHEGHGTKNICAASLKEDLVGLKTIHKHDYQLPRKKKRSDSLDQYFLGKLETGPWPRNHRRHRFPTIILDCPE